MNEAGRLDEPAGSPVGSARAPASAIVGRETELAALRDWLGGEPPGLLEIDGEAGIGKTTVWEEGVRLARDAGALVLACRPAEVESSVSYGALAALLEGVLGRVGGDVPSPRRRALEGALRLRDVPDSTLDETAVALGALSVLRAASRRAPVVIAVDDVQWLDGSSRVVLTYALRNLGPDDRVSVLLTTRRAAGEGPLALSGSTLARDGVRLRLSPLSVGAVHRIVVGRLGAPLSRPRLVRLHTVSGGNPLHAIELARVVASADRGDGALDVPESLASVLRARIAPLSLPARRLLVTVAAAGAVRPDVVGRLHGGETLEEAVEHGILVLAEGSLRFSHPLFASTVYADAGDFQRSRAHRVLADLAGAPEERARHLALAGSGADEAVAALLDRAAESACRRGARAAGAALHEQAAGVTPEDAHEARDARLIAAAEAHFGAGEPGRARTLLELVASHATPLSFEAQCVLGTLLDETVGGDASFGAFEAALASGNPAVVSRAHRGLAQSLAYVGNLERALEHADAAVRVAERLSDDVTLAYALAMQAFVRTFAGHPDRRAPLRRGLALETRVSLPSLDASPSAVAADLHRIDLELDEARAAYESLLGRASERGDVPTEAWSRYGLASVEIAAGRLGSADEHARELSDLAEQTALLRLPSLRIGAHLACLRGDVERARTALDAVESEGEAHGELHNLRSARQLAGFLALSLGDHRAAADALGQARAIAVETSVGAPGLLVFLLDEVEALAACGDHETARGVLESFDRRAAGGEAAWARPLIDRAGGLVLAAQGDLDGARATLEAAVAVEERVPLPLERARTRLVYGRVLRRTQHRGAAQTMLSQALARFEELGAPLWAERAGEELARVGGRAPASDDLTPTERRIAELVAAGMTNREVASTLFVTPKTVESALTRVYRKLGVRSRTELARQLA